MTEVDKEMRLKFHYSRNLGSPSVIKFRSPNIAPDQDFHQTQEKKMNTLPKWLSSLMIGLLLAACQGNARALRRRPRSRLSKNRLLATEAAPATEAPPLPVVC
jgi:hypothetical protein